MKMCEGYVQPENVFDGWGFQKQNAEFKQLLNASQSLLNILREKSDLQMAYAHGLNKLQTRLRDTLGSIPGGTVHSTWLQLVKCFETEANTHQYSAESIVKELVQPWSYLHDALMKARKPLKVLVDKAANGLVTGYTNEVKAKRGLVQAHSRVCDRLYASGTHSATGGAQRADTLDSSGSLRGQPSDRYSRQALTVALLHSNEASRSMATPAAIHAVSLAEKAKEQCSMAVSDYYKAFMHAEKARLEWHTVMLKSLSDHRNLERRRLEFLKDGLMTYHRIIEYTTNVLKSSADSLKEAIRLADPVSDLQHFRERCRRIVDDQHDQVATDGPAMGRSQQRLLGIPGEEAISPLADRSLGSNGTLKRTTLTSSNGSVIFNDIEIQRQCFTRSNLFHCLNLLRQDVDKEQKTKQGLSNLIQVYSLEPVFSDQKTLSEARSQLFVSRLRLVHLTSCLQKVTYSLVRSFLSEESRNSSSGHPARQHAYLEALERAGFNPFPWDSPAIGRSRPTSRWVPLPDLDDESMLPSVSRPLEWPPVPLNEMACEDINSELLEMEVRRVRQLDAKQCESLWISTCSSLMLSLRSSTDTMMSRGEESSPKLTVIPRPQWLTPSFVRPSKTSLRSLSTSREKTSFNGVTSPSPVENGAHVVKEAEYNAEPAGVLEGEGEERSFLQRYWAKQARPESELSALHENGHETKKAQHSASLSIARTTRSVGLFWPRYNPGTRSPSPQPFRSTKTSSSLRQTVQESPILLSDLLNLPDAGGDVREKIGGILNGSADVKHELSDKYLSSIGGKECSLNQLRNYPSNTSLHVIGWAKVMKSYTAERDGELNMRDGEMLSIIRKESGVWWYGELNGTKGRFRATHVEEF